MEKKFRQGWPDTARRDPGGDQYGWLDTGRQGDPIPIWLRALHLAEHSVSSTPTRLDAGLHSFN